MLFIYSLMPLTTSYHTTPDQISRPMEPQGNPWAQQQHSHQPIPMDNRPITPYADRSRSSSESSYDPTTVVTEPLVEPGRQQSRKRKSTEPSLTCQREHLKRPRIGGRGHTQLKDASTQLPAEAWHHVFTLLPPPTLGKLLSVNKVFNNYLDPDSKFKLARPRFPESDSHSIRPGHHRPLHPMLPETIWRTSRHNFLQTMPSPLRTKSELASWRLASSKRCQFCGIQSRDVAGGSWHRGPGAKGVIPIFPLLMLTCGPCLVENTVKEIDTLLSSSVPLVLLPALPAALVTPEMHVVLPQTWQAAGAAEREGISKVYSKEQIDALKAEFDGVKLLGSGAAEEWFKGLEARGASLLRDASRWEQWESSGGLKRMRQLIAEAQIPPPIPHLERPAPRDSKRVESETDTSLLNTSSNGNNAAVEPAKLTKRAAKRTKQEAMQLMKKRREEIERRAALLEPPLTVAVLSHLPSFQAAVQLTAPLDDDAWGVLAEKFLEQREAAEQEERKLRGTENPSTPADNGTASSKANGTRIHSLSMSRDPQKVPDEEWDDIQGPVRAKIADYADEIIRKNWDDGESVARKNCPTFAAQVLLHVRKRFYTEVVKEQAVAEAAGKHLTPDPPEGPWLRKLTLENMKWVFDVKIKPFTHKLRPELFLCHGCPNTKYFGLEGVIQHFSAKHTDALSLGNVVVFWRAEWPDVPPFMPDPKNPKVLSPQPQAAQTNPAAKAPATAGFGLPARPAPSQHLVLAGNLPSHGQQQNPAYTAIPSQPYDSNEFQYPPAGYQTPQESGRIFTGAASLSQAKPQLAFMAAVALRVDESVRHVDQLPPAVRLCVTIHHIAKDWQRYYNSAAPLALFQEALMGGHDMEPLQLISGLTCKACSESQLMNSENTMFARTLLQHFRQEHVEGRGPTLDWRTDMVSLPVLDVLYDLPRLLAHDGEAYHIVMDALPWAFAEPPPGASAYDAQEPAANQRQEAALSHSSNGHYHPAANGQQCYYGDERRPTQNQPHPVSRAQTRPPTEYHDEPARRGWPEQPQLAQPSTSTPIPGTQYFYPEAKNPPQTQTHRHPPHQQPATQAEEGEFEVVEVRDPQTGSLYHIRRRIQREPYQHYQGGPAQRYPPSDDYRRAGTVAPPARQEAGLTQTYPSAQGYRRTGTVAPNLAQTYPSSGSYRRAGTVAPPVGNEAEDYDPRYPAGTGPTSY